MDTNKVISKHIHHSGCYVSKDDIVNAEPVKMPMLTAEQLDSMAAINKIDLDQVEEMIEAIIKEAEKGFDGWVDPDFSIIDHKNRFIEIAILHLEKAGVFDPGC